MQISSLNIEKPQKKIVTKHNTCTPLRFFPHLALHYFIMLYPSYSENLPISVITSVQSLRSSVKYCNVCPSQLKLDFLLHIHHMPKHHSIGLSNVIW